MALKILMLRKNLTDEEKRNAQLRADLEAFNTRERELERSIEEASTEEERSTVQSAVDTFEQERQQARAGTAAPGAEAAPSDGCAQWGEGQLAGAARTELRTPGGLAMDTYLCTVPEAGSPRAKYWQG